MSGKQSCAPHKYVEFTHNFAIGNLQNVRKLSLYRLIIIYHNCYIKNDGLSFVYVVSFFPKNHVIYLPQIPASFSLIIKLIETSFPRNFPWVDFNHALRFVEYSLFGKKSLNCDTIKPQTLIALGKSGYEHFSWLHLFCEDAELQNGRLNHSFVKIRLIVSFPGTADKSLCGLWSTTHFYPDSSYHSVSKFIRKTLIKISTYKVVLLGRKRSPINRRQQMLTILGLISRKRPIIKVSNIQDQVSADSPDNCLRYKKMHLSIKPLQPLKVNFERKGFFLLGNG